MLVIGRALGALLMLVAVAGCGGGSDAADKYAQTWSKDYGSTTCSEWKQSMTEKERWVAAADLLTSARNADGAKSMPSDDLVDTFAGGVTTACAVDTVKVAEVGALLYLTERNRFAP